MTTAIDQTAVEEFAGRAIGDVAGTMTTVFCALGDKLGLFKALAEGPATAAQLAERGGVDERYALEWARGLTAADYLSLEDDRFVLPAAHATVLAQEDAAMFLGGGYQELGGMLQVLGRIAEAFREGSGVPQAAYPDDAYVGMSRFSRAWVDHHLLGDWMSLIPGLRERLDGGVSWADVGCGAGRRDQARSGVPGLDVHGLRRLPGTG